MKRWFAVLVLGLAVTNVGLAQDDVLKIEVTDSLNGPLTIPANQVKSFHEQYTIPVPVTLLGIAPHAHLICTNMKAFGITLQGDTIPFIDIPDWDFHWQGFYWFEQAIKVQPGDTFRISCVFDNSQANQPYLGGEQRKPKYLVWGEGTEEEMCLGYIQATLN